MKRLRLCALILLLCCMVTAQKTILDAPGNVKLYRAIRNWTFDAFVPYFSDDESSRDLYFEFNFTGRTGSDPRLREEAEMMHKTQPRTPDDVPFPCNVTGYRSAEPPTSVHRLKPGDIDVIAAMGDSLSAGAGIFATNVAQVIIENRGAAAAGGGQGTWRELLTLPNIFKEFNPKLIGFALGDSLTTHTASQLNVAEIGAMSRDMPFMAKNLIKRIKNDPRIDVENDWKLISIMIGPNDFCSDICWIPSPWNSLKNHKKNLVTTLRLLRDNLPRSFVALIPPPHLSALVNTRDGRSTLSCDFLTTLECSCLFGLQFRSRRPEYYEIMRSWQMLDMEIARYPEFHKEDFAVVAQPVNVNVTIPLAKDGYTDLSYLSSDCFHISQKGNAKYSNALWNSLLQIIGGKCYDWTAVIGSNPQFLCPTESNPYLITPGNTKENFGGAKPSCSNSNLSPRVDSTSLSPSIVSAVSK